MKASNLACIALFACAAFCASSASAGDGAVALQSADVSCPTISGRYVDCGNGTVTDNLTGLTWTKNASCWGQTFFTWDRASIEVLNLADGFCGLSDKSSPGEWRLPTKKEWETMVAAAKAIGSCDPTLTNDAGTNCYGEGPTSFTGVAGGEFGFYWSATTDSANVANAFLVAMISGNMSSFVKTGGAVRVWAVRGGQ